MILNAQVEREKTWHDIKMTSPSHWLRFTSTKHTRISQYHRYTIIYKGMKLSQVNLMRISICLLSQLLVLWAGSIIGVWKLKQLRTIAMISYWQVMLIKIWKIWINMKICSIDMPERTKTYQLSNNHMQIHVRSHTFFALIGCQVLALSTSC